MPVAQPEIHPGAKLRLHASGPSVRGPATRPGVADGRLTPVRALPGDVQGRARPRSLHPAGAVVVPTLPARALERRGPRGGQRADRSASWTLTSPERLAAGHRRGDFGPAPTGRAPERAQLVWRRALELAGPAQHDRFARALELLRVAHHSPAIVVHALTVGTRHLHAHPEDAIAREGVTILEAAIAFLGVRPQPGDIAVARR
jgi:hypothetical protein